MVNSPLDVSKHQRDIPRKISLDRKEFEQCIQIKNVFGKEDTLVTIQIDQMLAEKFGMEYIDADGSKKNPYIIHRTSIGCYERTLALLIEKYAGAFPSWMAPVQAKLIPISEKQADYVEELRKELINRGIRVEADYRNEKMGYKIRQAQMNKIPYMLVVGEKEIEDGVVAVRSRNNGENLGTMTIDAFIDLLESEKPAPLE